MHMGDSGAWTSWMHVENPEGAIDRVELGRTMLGWVEDLFPLNRSLTGDGVRETLRFLAGIVPGLRIHEVPSGTKVFDWTVPDEWNVREAFIADADGTRLIDFSENNLHLVGYSVPFHGRLSREELEGHLHSLPDQADAIPYVTSYYKRQWGFCLTESQRRSLGPGPFDVVIDATLAPGTLTYADVVIPGETDREVLISTYVCHPSMANNELSGPVVAAALARWVASLPRRRYSYRFYFGPETIGAITYLARHVEHLRSHVDAGWVLTCIGDERGYSYLPSRQGGTLADRITLHQMDQLAGGFRRYSYLDRASDERQWCSPGADLPVCSVMRTKYAEYPEYHTSLDTVGRVVTADGLAGGYALMANILTTLERNHRYRTCLPGEPQLGTRGLYPTVSTKKWDYLPVFKLMGAIGFMDGELDTIEIAELAGLRASEVASIGEGLLEHGVVRIVDPPGLTSTHHGR